MFMCQKRNETARLIWFMSHGPFIRSVQSAAQRELTGADVFTRSREH